jgi:hypothetical protein
VEITRSIVGPCYVTVAALTTSSAVNVPIAILTLVTHLSNHSDLTVALTGDCVALQDAIVTAAWQVARGIAITSFAVSLRKDKGITIETR